MWVKDGIISKIVFVESKICKKNQLVEWYVIILDRPANLLGNMLKLKFFVKSFQALFVYLFVFFYKKPAL